MSRNEVVQGLWVGRALSALEKLSIASFLANGHEYHLYVYDSVGDVPKGTVVKDAETILPSSHIFKNRNHDSYATFSDLFRYKLLFDRGGWWCDLDEVCLKPFQADSEYVFSTQYGVNEDRIVSGVIKAPRDAELMKYCFDACASACHDIRGWNDVGPDLLSKMVQKFSLTSFAKAAGVFCPVPSTNWFEILTPGRLLSFPSDPWGVHLWHELWRRNNIDPNEEFAPTCLYQSLRNKFARWGSS